MKDQSIGLILLNSGIISVVISLIAGTIIWFMQKKTEHRLTKQLEDQKHENAKELEIIRSQLSTIRDIQNTLRQKEIEITMAIWEKLQQARGAISGFTQPLQFYPNFDYMDESEFKEFIDKSKLSEKDKREFINSTNKNQNYQEMIFWYDLNEARNKTNDFHNYFILNRFFFTKELQEKLTEIDKLCRAAILDAETGRRMMKGRPLDESEGWRLINLAYAKVNEQSEPIVIKIESLIQQRLYIE